MTATFTVNNGTTTVTLEYEGATSKMQDWAQDCAHWLWDHGYGDHGTEEAPIVWGDLTNQEKLDLIDAYVRRACKDTAAAYHVNNAADTARDDAIDDIPDRYELSDPA